MPIRDWNGTGNYAIGKVYDNNGTANHQIGKVYDHDGTANHLIYTAEVVYYDRGNVINEIGSVVKYRGGGGGGAGQFVWSYSGEGGRSAFWYGKNPVDLTGIDKLYFECFGNTDQCYAGVVKNNPANLESDWWFAGDVNAEMTEHSYVSIDVTDTESQYFETMTVDVSSLTGEYYLILCATLDADGTARTRKVWGE